MFKYWFNNLTKYFLILPIIYTVRKPLRNTTLGVLRVGGPSSHKFNRKNTVKIKQSTVSKTLREILSGRCFVEILSERRFNNNMMRFHN
jgi:hypothetical protein